MCRYFKIIAGVGNGSCIYYWQSKRLSGERINSITASNYSVTPFFGYYGAKTIVKSKWKLFETRQNYLCCLKSSNHLHCLWDK